MARFLILTGIFILVIGLVFLVIERFTGRTGLPGDIIVRRGPVTIWFPIVTMLVLSLILTLILNLILRWR